VPDASADLGIWLDRRHPERKYDPLDSDCFLQARWPLDGRAQLFGIPTTISWTISNDCPDEQVIRIDYKGPKSPFASCDKDEVMMHLPFKVTVTGKNPPLVVNCKLVPGSPCTAFWVDVNTFPDRTNERPSDCPTSTGQIEIDPW
jgi:hypothetical protein